MVAVQEVLTIWRNTAAPRQHRLVAADGVAASAHNTQADGLVRAKLYEVHEDAARSLEWIETQSAMPDNSPEPLSVSRRLWDVPPDGAERMVLRLKRDVGDASVIAATWLYQVHTDLPDEIAAEYNEWYDQEHLPRLITVPGVLRARRYVAMLGEGPRYLTAYDLSDRDAFESPAGLVARKTPWTARMRALFTKTRRSMCRLVIPQGSP
jgi:hypothetical protein